MALIKWYDISADGDCLEDAATWNDMIDYIKHSACTDFTIYKTCPSTGQAFRFTHDGGTDSKMFGGDDTSDDLHIWGNDNATAVNIALLNTGEFKLFDGATEALKITYTGNVTTVEGGIVTGDDLVLKGSSANTYSKIVLLGNGAVSIYGKDAIYLYDNATLFMGFAETGTDDKIMGLTANNDLWLLPQGSGVLKYGTEVTNAGSDRGELIKMKTAAGDVVYVKTYDLV